MLLQDPLSRTSRKHQRCRPLGVLEASAYAVLDTAGQDWQVFIGHPLQLSHPMAGFSLVQISDYQWSLEIYNATSQAIETASRCISMVHTACIKRRDDKARVWEISHAPGQRPMKIGLPIAGKTTTRYRASFQATIGTGHFLQTNITKCRYYHRCHVRKTGGCGSGSMATSFSPGITGTMM